jgi:putative lipoprotein
MAGRNIIAVCFTFVSLISLIISCSSASYNYDDDIRNKYWRLIELEGKSITVEEGQREPHIIFKLNEENVTGSGGCNQFSGAYKIIGDSVQVGPLAITKKYCASIMETEEKFMQVLETGGEFMISGEYLELFSNKTLAAKFQVIYFNQ